MTRLLLLEFYTGKRKPQGITRSDTIPHKSLTWTEKLSVLSLI